MAKIVIPKSIVMKKIAIIIILLQSFNFINAQHEFKDTDQFVVRATSSEENTSYVLNLERKGDDAVRLTTLYIEDTELLEDVFVTTLENPGLKGVSSVIKMEVEYLACCAHVDAFYYMIKNDGEIVPLPGLQNVYCDDTDTDIQYTFPNQKHGVEGKILETETFYNDSLTQIKNINLKQSLTWVAGDIEKLNTTAITGY